MRNMIGYSKFPKKRKPFDFKKGMQKNALLLKRLVQAQLADMRHLSWGTVPVQRWGNLIGRMTTSFSASFAPSSPATSHHLTFSMTMDTAKNENMLTSNPHSLQTQIYEVCLTVTCDTPPIYLLHITAMQPIGNTMYAYLCSAALERDSRSTNWIGSSWFMSPQQLTKESPSNIN